MQLSSSLSDAVLSLSACYAAYTLHCDVSAFPLGADPSCTDRLLPSILTSVLPPHLHLISLTTLLEWGFALIGLAAAAGVVRFSGLLPSLSLPLHQTLTLLSTLLSLPCFALALLYWTAQGGGAGTAKAAASNAAGLSSPLPGLPVAAFFTSALSALLFFPLLFRHLPQPISLTSSSQLLSAAATLTLLVTALSHLFTSPTSPFSFPLTLILLGSLPLLLSTALLTSYPSSSHPPLPYLPAIDLFHYAFALTCMVWLYAFRRLFGVGGTGVNRVDAFYPFPARADLR